MAIARAGSRRRPRPDSRPPGTAQRLRKALLALPLLLVPALLAAHQDETYNNPVDRKAYTAPGGWKTYAPDTPAPPSTEKVDLENVRLLQDQEEMAARTSVPDLAAFIKVAQAAASGVFAHYDKAASLLVQFTCTPGKHVVQIASQGKPPQELLEAYYDKLVALEPLKVSGEVKFQFLLKVSP
jgi:hypothetical protein